MHFKICCKWLKLYIQDKKFPIYYNSIFREYYLNSLEENTIILLDYCPWCSTKLPKSLREIFFDILEIEYGIEINIFEILNENNLPEEFASDEWWKKRNIKNNLVRHDDISVLNHKRLFITKNEKN